MMSAAQVYYISEKHNPTARELANSLAHEIEYKCVDRESKGDGQIVRQILVQAPKPLIIHFMDDDAEVPVKARQLAEGVKPSIDKAIYDNFRRCDRRFDIVPVTQSNGSLDPSQGDLREVVDELAMLVDGFIYDRVNQQFAAVYEE
ncbi:MAG: hypothetical protein AAF984_00120 [Verrucomicrobiota bacterium]